MPIQPNDIDVIVPVLRQRSGNLRKRAELFSGKYDIGSVVTRGMLEFLAREFESLADAFVQAQQATQNLDTELKKEEGRSDEQP